MSQQIQINYGAAPNDGQGDPLRTAFIKTDENFDNIWLAGPVGSNVTITDNTISVVNTNGNLVLRPNGVGAIQTNARLLPRATQSYDIGSQTLQYRGIYASNLDVAIANIGNLSADNFYIGNTLFTRTLTVGRAVSPVTIPLTTNNTFNVGTATGNVAVYTT